MKKLFLLILLLAIGIMVKTSHSAQYWAKTYGGGKAESANYIQQITDGGYIVAGNTNSFGAGDIDFWVMKLDSNGNISWEKTYGGGDADWATCIQQTLDGGYIMAGYIRPTGIYNYHDILILKLDSNANISWQKTYGGSGIDIAGSIQQTTDGGYIVAGYTKSFGAGDIDFWVMKLDSNGNISWEKTYGGIDDDYASSILQTTDDGYIVAGYVEHNHFDYDIWVLKLDNNGNVTWQRTYGSVMDWGPCIQQTLDGGYIVAGYTSSAWCGSNTLLLKLESNGDVTWQKTYKGCEREFDNIDSIQQTSNGCYIMAGSTTTFGFGTSDTWVLKLDSNGEIPDCDIIESSDSFVSNTSILDQDSNATVQSTSATINDTNFLPQDSSAEITTICEGDKPCPLEKLFGEYSKQIELLRYLRDNILSKTPEGQEIIRLYYEWSSAIVKAMEEDEEFKEGVKAIINGILLLIRAEVF